MDKRLFLTNLPPKTDTLIEIQRTYPYPPPFPTQLCTITLQVFFTKLFRFMYNRKGMKTMTKD
jgi:hypothetical protein